MNSPWNHSIALAQNRTKLPSSLSTIFCICHRIETTMISSGFRSIQNFMASLARCFNSRALRATCCREKRNDVTAQVWTE